MSQSSNSKPASDAEYQDAEGHADDLEQVFPHHQSPSHEEGAIAYYQPALDQDGSAAGPNDSTVRMMDMSASSASWLHSSAASGAQRNVDLSEQGLQSLDVLEGLAPEQLQQALDFLTEKKRRITAQLRSLRPTETVIISDSESGGEAAQDPVSSPKGKSDKQKTTTGGQRAVTSPRGQRAVTSPSGQRAVTSAGSQRAVTTYFDTEPHVGGRVSHRPPPQLSGQSKAHVVNTSPGINAPKKSPSKPASAVTAQDAQEQAPSSPGGKKRPKGSSQSAPQDTSEQSEDLPLASVDYSKILNCPVCGKRNTRIRGNLQQHYFTCKDKNNSMNPSAEELLLLRVITETKRILRGQDRGLQEEVKKEERHAERAKGTRDLHSEDSEPSLSKCPRTRISASTFSCSAWS